MDSINKEMQQGILVKMGQGACSCNTESVQEPLLCFLPLSNLIFLGALYCQLQKNAIKKYLLQTMALVAVTIVSVIHQILRGLEDAYTIGLLGRKGITFLLIWKSTSIAVSQFLAPMCVA